MNEITIASKTYPIYGSGKTLLIYMNDLHKDFFRDVAVFISSFAGNGATMPPIEVTSRLCYALIRTANPEAIPVGGYNTWLESILHLGDFISENTLASLLTEVNEVMETDESAKGKKESQDSKKK